MKFNFGGINHHSLVDWDGMVTDVIFANKCNMRCGYCQNHELIMRDDMVDTDDILKMIDYDFIDGVVFSGGEPTVQCETLVEMVKDIYVNTDLKIAIETNGTRPDVIDELSPYLDQVFMDFKASPFKYPLDLLGISETDVKQTFESMELVDNLRIPLELRTTCFTNIISEHDIEVMGEFIESTFRYEPTWVLQQGHVDNVLDSDIFDNNVVYDSEQMMELGDIGRTYVEDMYIHTMINGREIIR